MQTETPKQEEAAAVKKDLKFLVKQIAEASVEVFDLVGRNVPSNHSAKVQAHIEKLKEVVKELS